MRPVEHQRLDEVVAVRDGEEPCPEVVVLALEVLRVVPERVLLQDRAVDEHRRVEEGRAEEGCEPHFRAPGRHDVERADAIALVDLEHGAPDHREIGIGPEVRELPLEAIREGDVVGVEPGDVAPSRSVEGGVQGAGEALRLVVADDDETGVVELAEDGRRRIARPVIDDDQLQVVDRLAQDACDCASEEALAVLHREED